MEQKNTNIQVAIRVRPLISSEKENKLKPQWSTQETSIFQINDYGHHFGEVYTFDHIFDSMKNNLDIYNDIVRDFVTSSVHGVNSTIFAYGQTSSGKTFTMLGNKQDRGIMNLAVDNIFEMIGSDKERKYLVKVSYIEIYNEKIHDLLEPSNRVKLRTIYPGTIGLQNIKEEIISSKEQIFESLKTGTLNRRTESTFANDRSSRSHTIFKITIESTEVNFNSSCGSVQVSNLNLVDLAGSERVAQTKATGIRLKEGGHINKSLSTLALVIRQLSECQDFISFRDSKLTHLLQDSLGGNSKTLIIATITSTSIEDTNSTLAFAQRAKAVKNKPQVNQILTQEDVMKQYATSNNNLKKQLKEQILLNEQIQDERNKEIKRLQLQLYKLEEFQSVNVFCDIVDDGPKRRHTIGFSARKPPRLLKDEKFEFSTLDIVFEDPSDIRNLATSTAVTENLETILEECITPKKSNNRQELLEVRTNSTPKSGLRSRLSALTNDYNELVDFTRLEDRLNDDIDEVSDSKQLLEAQQKLLEYEIKLKQYESNESVEKQLSNKIAQAEQILSYDDVIDLPDCRYILENLILLQQYLESSNDNLKDSSVTDRFIQKVKRSKNIIESEILKQINGVVDDQNVSETDCIDNLIDELSLFESDCPEVIKKNCIEDMKILNKIYQGFVKKNEQIRNLDGMTKSREMQNDEFSVKIEKLIEEVERYKAEATYLNSTINKLNSRISEKDNIISNLENNRLLSESPDINLKSIVEQHENECVNMKFEMKQLTEFIKEKDVIISNLRNNCETFDNDIIKLKKDLENRNFAFEEKCKNEYLEEVKKLQAYNDTEILEFKSKINEKDQYILKLESNCAVLQKSIEDLKSELGDNNFIITQKCKEEYNEKVKELQYGLDELKTELNEKNLKISKLEVDDTDLRKCIENLTQELKSNINGETIIEELKNKNNELETREKDMQENMTKLQKDLEHSQELQKLQCLKDQEIVNLKNEKADLVLQLEASGAELQKNIENLKKALENSEELKNLQYLNDQQIVDLKNQIKEKENVVLQSEASSVELQRNIEKLQKDVENIEELKNLQCLKEQEIVDLKNQINEKDNLILQLEANSAELQKNIENLQKVFESNEGPKKLQCLEEQEIMNLKNQIREKEDLILHLETSGADLQKNVEKLQKDLESMEELKNLQCLKDEEILYLKNQINEKEELVLQLEVRSAELERNVLELRNQISDNKEVTANLEHDCSLLRKHIEELKNEVHCNSDELQNLKHVHAQEVLELKNQISDKEKIILNLQNSSTQLQKDSERLRKELEGTNVVIQDTLKKEVQELREKLQSANNLNSHQENLILRLQQDIEQVKGDLKTTKTCLKQQKEQFNKTELSNEEIKQALYEKGGLITRLDSQIADLMEETSLRNAEIKKLETVNSKLQSDILVITEKVQEKDDMLIGLEKRCAEYERLQIEINDQLVSDMTNEKNKLLNELEYEKTNNLSKQEEINSLKNIVSNLNTKLKDLQEEYDRLKKKSDSNKCLEKGSENAEIIKLLKCSIREKEEYTIKIEDLTQERENLKKEIQLLMEREVSHIKQVDEIKQLLLEKEQMLNELTEQQRVPHKIFLKSVENTDVTNVLQENRRLELQLQKQKEMLTSSKVEQHKHKLAKENLRQKIKDLKKHYSNLELEREDLVSAKQKVENFLCTLIEHILKEQKSLHTSRHSQEQRELLKTTLKEEEQVNSSLKRNISSLKDNSYNLDELVSNLMRAISLFREYFIMEKIFVQMQVEQLKDSNKAYEREIYILKEQGDRECVLGKENKVNNSNDLETNVNVQTYLKKIKEQEELLETYKQKISHSDAQVGLCDTKPAYNSIEVQCNLLTDNPLKLSNYLYLKEKCETQKRVIRSLKDNITELKRPLSTVDTSQNEKKSGV